ncbi:MAG: DUF1343 domain-containing protein [Acidobacteriota bacterium]
MKRVFQSFQRSLFVGCLLILFTSAACGREDGRLMKAEHPMVKTGLEIFLESGTSAVKNKKVGLITNPTGRDSGLRDIVQLFMSHPDIELAALYGPEHGIRGNAQAGEYIPFYRDDVYGLPVFSLYGQSLKPPAGMFNDIDAYMREFDTMSEGKTPASDMVEALDVMVFDIQDVGTRIYTYIATMAYCMETCAEIGIPFIVLDRPNPINGLQMEGPILDYPAFSSFVGLFPIPVRHGMTVGELARMFNDRFLANKVDLTVIPMTNWSRDLWFDETGLPWIFPSPNMPSLDTAVVYPGQVFLEGTNLSEGRGTTKPFELFGAPWIDGHQLESEMNALSLPGVFFREAYFTPTFSKYEGQHCGGCQIHVTDRDLFASLTAVLHIIQTVRRLYPEQFEFHADYFDKIMGTDTVRNALEADTPVATIVDGFKRDLEEFSRNRKEFLLY